MRTTARIVEDISQLKKQGKWFWVVFLGSWWRTKTAQVFICKVSGDFEVTEEIHLMNSVHGIATDRNIY